MVFVDKIIIIYVIVIVTRDVVELYLGRQSFGVTLMTNMEVCWGSGGGQGMWCASQEMVGRVLRVVMGLLVGMSVGAWAVAVNWCIC